MSAPLRTVGELKKALERFPDCWEVYFHTPGDPLPGNEELARHSVPAGWRPGQRYQVGWPRREHVDSPSVIIPVHKPDHQSHGPLGELFARFNAALRSEPHRADLTIRHLEVLIRNGVVFSVNQVPEEYELVREAVVTSLLRPKAEAREA